MRAGALWNGTRAGGWGTGLRLVTPFLLAPQAIDIGCPGNLVRSLVILGFASARGEIVGFQPKAGNPAASKSAIPKGWRLIDPLILRLSVVSEFSVF